MSLIKDALEFMFRTGETNAESSRKLSQVKDVGGLAGVRYLQLANGDERIVTETDSQSFSVDSLIGLRQVLELTGVREVVVECLPSSVRVRSRSFSEITLGDDCTTAYVDSILNGVFAPEASVAWENAKNFVLAPLAEARMTSPKGLVNLLARNFGSYIDPAAIAPFRNVRFEALATGQAITESGKSGFGKSLEATVQKVESLPKRIRVEIPRFRTGIFTVAVFIEIEPEPETSQFAVFIRGDEWERAELSIAEQLWDAVSTIVEDVNSERHEQIKVVRSSK